MPDFLCKFHWEDEPDRGWKAIYRDCGVCGASKTWSTGMYSVWPDGSKHPEPPAWLCYPCGDRNRALHDEAMKKLEKVREKIRAKRKSLKGEL